MIVKASAPVGAQGAVIQVAAGVIPEAIRDHLAAVTRAPIRVQIEEGRDRGQGQGKE